MVLKARIGRARYWGLSVICMLAGAAGLYGIVSTVNETSHGPTNFPANLAAIGGALVFLTACVMIFGVGIWRLHDRGRSGFWIIPYYIAPVVLAFLANDPDGKRTAFEWMSYVILAWAIIDLGILEDRESSRQNDAA